MGTSRLKRQRFFAEHPHCCFCGGMKLATTIDHVPNRACFLGRYGPETFEFPACDACQRSTRLDEIAFTFTVTDHNKRNYDRAESQRAISGLVNNLLAMVRRGLPAGWYLLRVTDHFLLLRSHGFGLATLHDDHHTGALVTGHTWPAPRQPCHTAARWSAGSTTRGVRRSPRCRYTRLIAPRNSCL
jgi:hypothetical protein